MTFVLENIPSPTGEILLVTRDEDVVALDFADCESRMLRLLESRFEAVKLVPRKRPSVAAKLVHAYLGGDAEALDRIKIHLSGTKFQEKVWRALRKIRCGETLSYGELAHRLGRPTAARAVGAANGRNPIALIVPCHRVLASNGSLHGYAGGLARKQWLLEHESRIS